MGTSRVLRIALLQALWLALGALAARADDGLTFFLQGDPSSLSLSSTPSNQANARELPARDNTVKIGESLSLGVFLGPVATASRKIPLVAGQATVYLVSGASGMAGCGEVTVALFR